MMTALFGSGWSGMGMLEDMDRGLMDRYLVAPTHRSSLIVGRILSEALPLVVQAAIIGALAWLLGAEFAGGAGGFAVLVLGAVLLAFAFAAISNAIALLVRQRESVIGANTMLVLPLTFLSAAFMPLGLVPDWIGAVAAFNPVNWAVEAGARHCWPPRTGRSSFPGWAGSGSWPSPAWRCRPTPSARTSARRSRWGRRRAAARWLIARSGSGRSASSLSGGVRSLGSAGLGFRPGGERCREGEPAGRPGHGPPLVG
jgi:hypothetical protein